MMNTALYSKTLGIIYVGQFLGYLLYKHRSSLIENSAEKSLKENESG